MFTLSDQVASKVAEDAYKREIEKVKVKNLDGEKIIYNVIETIEDKDTGLHGYVLENENAEEVVISFEGTQLENSLTQSVNDVNEDIVGIVLGTSDYTSEESQPTNYRPSSPIQNALIASGQAKIEDGKFIKINKNQFTEADKVVKKYVKERGAGNINFVGHSLGGALAEYFAITYDSHAVTFASPDIYNLLTEAEKKSVDNGDFKDNIISYTYPDDIFSSFAHHSVGSTYFLSHPGEAGSRKGIDNHYMRNYTQKDMYDDNGYFIPTLLFDETLFGQLEKSPLALKNSGAGNFNILIKASIMAGFVTEERKQITLIENTEKALLQFMTVYTEEMKALKSKYNWMVGTGQYDKLSSADVGEVFSELGEDVEGVPFIFSLDHYEEILHKLKLLLTDTEEVAFHMHKMSEDFEEADTLLAQWLQYDG